MAIFPNLELEDVVQLEDKTRLSATKSFVSKDNAAITLVRIEPHTGDGFITISGTGLTYKDWYLDWQYSSAGTKTVTVEITAGSTVTYSKTIEAVTSATDKLWSDDSDLIGYEPDILKYIPQGRNSFKNIHRSAQRLILDWLYAIRIYKNDGSKITKDDLIPTEDVKQLSIYWTLYLIWQGMSNKPDDVFAQKASNYLKMVNSSKNSGRIQADFNDDGDLDTDDNIDKFSGIMVRR